MQSLSSLRALALITGLLFAGHGSAVEPSNAEYSATSVSEFAGGAIKSRVYHTPTKERRETTAQGMNSISILRHDRKVMWMLMPDNRMYMEMPLSKAPKDDLSAYRFEQTAVGPEVVNGINTTKYKIVMTHGDGSKFSGHMWMTKEGIMVKLDAVSADASRKQHIKTELFDLKIGPQPAALFEVPAGFVPMNMPGMNLEALMNQKPGGS